MLPKFTLVREEKEKNGDETYLLTFESLDEAVRNTEGEVVTIGLYKLVNTRKARLSSMIVGKIKTIK